MTEKDFPSIGIKKNDLSKPIFNTLVEVAMKVSEKQFAASQADIRTIQSARTEAIKAVTSHFDAMITAAEQRRENLFRYTAVRFISLGNDGFMNTLLSRWGLAPGPTAVEEEGPFDGRDYSAKFVAAALAYDFKDYIASVLSRQISSPGNAGRLTVLQPSAVSSGASAAQEMTDRYQQRVDNFRRWIASDQPQVILYHSCDAEAETQQAVQFMFEKLSRMREGKKTLCLWIYTPDPSSPAAEWVVDLNHTILQATYPMDNYTWNLPVHTFSGRGQSFEKKLVTGIKMLLDEAGIPRPEMK